MTMTLTPYAKNTVLLQVLKNFLLCFKPFWKSCHQGTVAHTMNENCAQLKTKPRTCDQSKEHYNEQMREKSKKMCHALKMGKTKSILIMFSMWLGRRVQGFHTSHMN